VALGYTWILGVQHRWSIGLDAGAQRIFPVGELRDGIGTDFWFALPAGGVSVGYVTSR
jgi:hypothetical protein